MNHGSEFYHHSRCLGKAKGTGMCKKVAEPGQTGKKSGNRRDMPALN
jgi:hypothetical protein